MIGMSGVIFAISLEMSALRFMPSMAPDIPTWGRFFEEVQMFDFTCLNCNSKFQKATSRNSGRPWKFCSVRCVNDYTTEKACKRCGKLFQATIRQKHCSANCRTYYWDEHNKKRFMFTCEYCGKAFGNKRRTNIYGDPWQFCSLACCNRSRRKEYRILDYDGYAIIWEPNHPRARDGRVFEHLVVAEKTIGRPLKKGEIVHHRNRKKDDNAPGNLKICKNYMEHIASEKMTIKAALRIIHEQGLSKMLTEYILKEEAAVASR